MFMPDANDKDFTTHFGENVPPSRLWHKDVATARDSEMP
jgi:hypothetical protein